MNPGITNAIVILLLILIVANSVRKTSKHIQGEGDCCGGGSEPVELPRKKLTGKPSARRQIFIEGMHCQRCEHKVTRALNCLDGVAVKYVSAEKGTAIVHLEGIVPDELLRQAVESQDFKVFDIAEL